MAILEPFALAIGFLLSYSYDFTNSYGFSIVVLTIIINIIIFPLTLRQTRSTKRMQDIQPELKKLQKQHKDNKEQLNKEIAELSRTHNNANILSIPSRFVSLKEAKEMVKIFLNTDFEGGRHLTRINKIPK